MKKHVGVLCVQGAFIEHIRALKALGCSCIEIRNSADITSELDALVLPGGESTAQSRLLHDLQLFDVLKAHIEQGIPTLATCAGLILLAKTIEGTGDLQGLHAQAAQKRLAVKGFQTLDVCVQRNAYGRQLSSFHTQLYCTRAGRELPATFIRAPRIVRCESNVEVLMEYENSAVAVQQGNQIACTFHPELDSDLFFHETLISL